MKSFTCRKQYLAMAFAQLTRRESPRDIETYVRAQRGKLYHMGFKHAVSRSTMADANTERRGTATLPPRTCNSKARRVT